MVEKDERRKKKTVGESKSPSFGTSVVGDSWKVEVDVHRKVS